MRTSPRRGYANGRRGMLRAANIALRTGAPEEALYLLGRVVKQRMADTPTLLRRMSPGMRDLAAERMACVR